MARSELTLLMEGAEAFSDTAAGGSAGTTGARGGIVGWGVVYAGVGAVPYVGGLYGTLTEAENDEDDVAVVAAVLKPYGLYVEVLVLVAGVP